MNQLSIYEVERLRRFILDGASVRQMVQQTKHAKATVMRYRKLFLPNLALCACGMGLKHRGWCATRLAGSPARQRIVAGLHSNKCLDCGRARNYTSMRCIDCYRARAAEWAAFQAKAKRPCKICGKQHLIRIDNVSQKTCGREWCNRLYTFYYVEGRSRPPTVRGEKRGLRFEFLLSDYIRRFANGQRSRNDDQQVAGP